jgi:hypothetical protein
MNFKEAERENVHWIHVTPNRDLFSAFVNTVPKNEGNS